jgi:glutathione-regulated potassium-efflux system ancillary protein KefG
VLVLFAHPAVHRSRVNRRLASRARAADRVTFHDLYEAYPDLDVDVEREQALLVEHDVVVMQHPFYWYSTPAILKQWQDLVLEHGWAYGREGTALHGKTMMNAITAGGGKEAYQKDGYNHYRIRELLAPFEQTARLCGMQYLPPFVVHGTHRLTDDQIESYAEDYGRLLSALGSGAIDWLALQDVQIERINDDLERWLEPTAASRSDPQGAPSSAVVP